MGKKDYNIDISDTTNEKAFTIEGNRIIELAAENMYAVGDEQSGVNAVSAIIKRMCQFAVILVPCEDKCTEDSLPPLGFSADLEKYDGPEGGKWAGAFTSEELANESDMVVRPVSMHIFFEYILLRSNLSGVLINPGERCLPVDRETLRFVVNYFNRLIERVDAKNQIRED